MDKTIISGCISCSIVDLWCRIFGEFRFDLLWFIPIHSIYCYGKTIDFSLQSSSSFSFFSQLSVTAICLFIILPLTAIGTVLGRNISGEPNYPCRTNAVPRPIPEKKWCALVEENIYPF